MMERATRGERRRIVAVTFAFMALSGALHFLLGYARPDWGFQEAAQQSPAPFEISTLERPSPTPRPTPTPTSKPQPTTSQHVAQSSAAPKRIPVVRLVDVVSQPGKHVLTPPAGSGSPQPTQPISPEPAPAVTQTPIDARDVVVSARFINRVQSDYPLIAVENRWEGTVIILLTIGPGGPSDVRIGESSGYAILDRAALRAAEESRYSVPEINGQPATETYRIIYTFSLDP